MSTYAGLSDHTKRMMEMATEGHKAEIDRLRKALERELAENKKLKYGAKLFDFEIFVCGQQRRLEAVLRTETVPSDGVSIATPVNQEPA